MSRITATPEQLQEMAQAAQDVERERGIPADQLMTIFSFETAGSLDPWKAGLTTQWGQHRGLIQWGEPQARQYGVNQNTSVRDQVFAAADYLADRNYSPGMSLENMYAAVLAGDARRTGVGDLHNGGVARSAAHAVQTQFGPHTAAATEVLSSYGGAAQFGPPIPADYVGPQYANVASPTPAPAPQPVGDMIASAFGPSVPPNATSQIAALPAVPAQGYGGRGELSPQPVGDMIASAFGPSVPPNAPSQIAALPGSQAIPDAVTPQPDLAPAVPDAVTPQPDLAPAVPAQGYGGRGELSPQQVASQQGGASSGSSERVPSFDLFGSSQRLEAERLSSSVTAQAGPSPAGPAFPVTPASNYAPPTYGGRGELSPQQVAQQQNPSTAGDSSGGGFWSSFADLFGGQTSNPNPAPQASARQETTPRLSEAFDTRWETRSVPNPNFNPIPQGLAEQYAMRALGGSQSRPMGPNGVGLGPAAQQPTILERVPIQVPINLAPTPAPPIKPAAPTYAPSTKDPNSWSTGGGINGFLNGIFNNPSPSVGTNAPGFNSGAGGSVVMPESKSSSGSSGGGGGGCFITTAVCDWLGRPDDCEELEVLRAFRDGYMMADPDREAQIKEYYEIAPQLVERVNAMANSDDVWLTVYGAFLVPAVKCIQAAHWAEAHEIYTDLVFWLKGATELHAPDS